MVQILWTSNPKIQPMIPRTAPSNCKQEKHSSRACCTLFYSFACVSAAKLLNQSSSWSEVSFTRFLYCKHSTPFSSVLWQMSEFKGLSSAAMMSTAPSQKQTMPQDLSEDCRYTAFMLAIIHQFQQLNILPSAEFYPPSFSQFKASLKKFVLGF